MPSKIICVSRGSDDIENAFKRLDETQVQLLYTKFPVGTGTFKRNKFIYVIFIGPRCSIVKRGKGIAEINAFSSTLDGAAGISTTDKASLTFAFLLQQMRKVFVTDTGDFSLERIQEEYKARIREEQSKMHPDVSSVPSTTHVQQPRPIVQEESEYESTMKELNSTNASCEVDEHAQRVLDAVHAELGPLNWVTFEPNPNHLTIADAGNGGIFELVKFLPDTKWLFGLFRITLGSKDERTSRVIFFQWIGRKISIVRQGPMTRIFPKISAVLAPYSLEIYLVGAQDLNPQAIITKSRHAFAGAPGDKTLPELTNKMLEDTRAGLRHVDSVFSEEEYKLNLEAERQKIDLNFDFIRPKRKSCSSGKVIQCQDHRDEARIYDTTETLNLVNMPEGGLVWAIFEVQ